MSFVQDSYFRLFASEREPVRKSSFIFFGGGGKPENSNRKSEKYRKSVTHQFKIQTINIKGLCILQ